MENKLELKHLACYLPYGLKIKFMNNDSLLTMSCESEPMRFNTIGILSSLYHINKCELQLILRPLSDLTKDIEIDGKKFVPLEACCMDYTTEIDFIEDNKAIWQSHEHTHLVDYSYEIKEIEILNEDNVIIEEFCKDEVFKTQLLNYDRFFQLCEWHFDVFGLIEKGLAIDKNTL